MNAEANASDIDLDAMPRAECNAPESRIANTLNGDAGHDSKNRKDDEGEEIADDDQAEQE